MLINQVYNQIDDLIGSLTATMVNYPDTQIRLEDSIKGLKHVLQSPNETMEATIEDLLELKHYFLSIIKHYPELKESLDKNLILIDWLLGND